MRTWRQESTSIPSRLVSILILSMVRLSTPVARMREVSAHEDGNVADQDIAAELQRDGLISHALVGSLREAFAIDRPWPRIAMSCRLFAPDQTVVKIGVAEILVLVPLLLAVFDRIVDVRIVRGVKRGALLEKQRDVALQMDRSGQISSRRKIHCAARPHRGFDRPIDGAVARALPSLAAP